jgi:hypothetical protein
MLVLSVDGIGTLSRHVNTTYSMNAFPTFSKVRVTELFLKNLDGVLSCNQLYAIVDFITPHGLRIWLPYLYTSLQNAPPESIFLDFWPKYAGYNRW